MKKLALIGALFGVAAASALAQDTPTPIHYRVSNLNIALTGYVQGQSSDTTMTATRVRVTNKDINTQFGQPKGQLLLLTPDDGSAPLVLVRTGRGTTATETDVSGNFGATTIGSVEQSRTTAKGTSGKVYSIDHFTLAGTDTNPLNGSFDVQGFTTRTLPTGAFSSQVNGTGDVQGAPAVVNGRISTTGGTKFEDRLP